MELKAMIQEKTEEAGRARKALAETERRLKELKEIQYQLTQYKENLPFHQRYKKSKYPDRYLRMHETQLILFDGARRKLPQIGITPKPSELQQVNDDIDRLEERRAEQQKNYKSAESKRRRLEQNLKIYRNSSGSTRKNRKKTKPKSCRI